MTEHEHSPRLYAMTRAHTRKHTFFNLMPFREYCYSRDKWHLFETARLTRIEIYRGNLIYMGSEWNDRARTFTKIVCNDTSARKHTFFNLMPFHQYCYSRDKWHLFETARLTRIEIYRGNLIYMGSEWNDRARTFTKIVCNDTSARTQAYIFQSYAISSMLLL